MDYKELMKSVGVQSCVTHSCPRCQNPVKCGVMQGLNDCWCFSVQSKGLDMNDVCMCKKCLKEA